MADGTCLQAHGAASASTGDRDAMPTHGNTIPARVLGCASRRDCGQRTLPSPKSSTQFSPHCSLEPPSSSRSAHCRHKLHGWFVEFRLDIGRESVSATVLAVGRHWNQKERALQPARRGSRGKAINAWATAWLSKSALAAQHLQALVDAAAHHETSPFPSTIRCPAS